jgi:3D (Asp-Asp-Asp) domain-containing protein
MNDNSKMLLLLFIIGIFNLGLSFHNLYMNKEIHSANIEYRESIVPMQYVSANMVLSAYTNAKNETNEDNTNTAIMEDIVVGWSCAVSRDYMHWLGGRVYIKGYGVRYVNDLMNERYKKGIDICVGTKKEAKRIGRVENVKVVFLGR